MFLTSVFKKTVTVKICQFVNYGKITANTSKRENVLSGKLSKMKNIPNSDMKKVLCCCEYRNEDGKKSHVMAVCCDCEVIDQAFERLITCKPISSNTCSRILTVISDRLRVPWCDGQGARKVDPEIMLAVLLMPFTMIIAAQGWFLTICTFIFLPIVFIFLFLKFARTRPHTHFFASWSVTSFVFLLGVFELEVVPYLEILFSENLILMCFVAVMCLCAYLTRINSSSSTLASLKISTNSNRNFTKAAAEQTQCQKCVVCNMIQPPRSSHCKLCGHCVLRKDHHCVWLDICVGARNHRYFVVGLLSLLMACSYGANLTLTTICHPTLVWGTVLLPDNCSDVYGDIHISLCFVSAAYTLLIAAATLLALLHQFWLICHNTTLEEWKQGQSGLYNKGILKNWAEFYHGY